jgi:hypothetical protein
VSENKLERKINGGNKEKVTERWKILHNEKLPVSSAMIFIVLADIILVKKCGWISQATGRRKIERYENLKRSCQFKYPDVDER